MKDVYKILLVNIIVLLAYSLMLRIQSAGSHETLGLLLGSCALILIQVFLNIILSAIFHASGKKKTGQAFMLNAALILLIGFGVCLGNANIR